MRLSIELRHGTTSDGDWEAPEEYAEFFGGTSTTNYRMFINSDEIPEDDETFEIAASWHDVIIGASFIDAISDQFLLEPEVVATGTIRDDDESVLISIGPASSPEGDLLTFPVRLDRPINSNVEMDYTT